MSRTTPDDASLHILESLATYRLTRVADTLAHHPARRLLERGLFVTLNSDDPAYFGGYVGDNFVATAAALGMSDADLVQCARNSFDASFLDDAAKASYQAEIDRFVRE